MNKTTECLSPITIEKIKNEFGSVRNFWLVAGISSSVLGRAKAGHPISVDNIKRIEDSIEIYSPSRALNLLKDFKKQSEDKDFSPVTVSYSQLVQIETVLDRFKRE